MSRSRVLRAVTPPLALALAILPVACDSPTDTPDVQLHVLDATLEAVGDSLQLKALVSGTDAEATWESLDPDVVAVSSAGMARAVAAGDAAVRVRVGRDEAVGTVTVLPAIDIRVSDVTLVTSPEGAEGIRARVRNLGGRGFYRLEYWKLDAAGVHRRVMVELADAEAPAGMDIVHTTYLGGEPADWVIAYSREPLAGSHVRTGCGGRDGFLCPDTLPEQPAPAVDSVTLSPAAAILQVGETRQYTARAFAQGLEVTGRHVEWSTPSPSVISISGSGMVQALSSGYGEVHASVEGVTTAVGLTVATPEPTTPAAYIRIRTPKLHMWVSQIWTVQADVFDARGILLEGHAVSWAVEDTLVARVDAEGVVLARAPGTTRLRATAGAATNHATIKSFARPVGSAELAFFGMLSDTSASMITPTFPTTWVDEHGASHPAYVAVRGGAMSLDWSGAETAYTQRLSLATYVTDSQGARIVDEVEYVDEGSLVVYFDLFTGNPIFDFTSSTTSGLTYRATFYIPGELVVRQTVGEFPERPFFFHLQ